MVWIIQVTALHQQKYEEHHSSSHHHQEEHVNQEVREWQQMAKKEKHYAEYAETSAFSSVSISLFVSLLSRGILSNGHWNKNSFT